MLKPWINGRKFAPSHTIETDQLDRLNNNVEAAETAEINTRTHFDHALKGVQVQLADREKLIESHREAVNGLQEQLTACNARIANEEAQKSTAHEKVNELKDRNAALQLKVSALETQIPSTDDSQIWLNETRLELEKTAKELSSSKADFEAQAEEIEALRAANTKLEEQVKALQGRLQEVQNQDDSANVQREELERKVQEAEREVQNAENKVQEAERRITEQGNHCESVIGAVKTQTNNEVKKLTAENNRLRKQNESRQEELVSLRQQVSQMQPETPKVSNSSKQELEHYKKRDQSQENQIQELESKLDDFKMSATKLEAMHEKFSTLSAQFSAESSKLTQMTEQYSELQHQFKQLDEEKEETALAKNQACEELANLRNEMDSKAQELREELTEVREELEEAKEQAARDTVGLEHLKKSCKDTVDKANKDRERQIGALQAQLSEYRTELQDKQDKYNSLWNDTDKAYKQENQKWEADKLQAESDHNRAMEELQITMSKQHATLKKENEELRVQLQTAGENLQSHPRPSSRDSRTSTRLHVQSTKDGIPLKKTPNTDIRPTQPSKPRKVIDRTKSETREVGPIRVPDGIRPDSGRTNFANAQATVKGPVVEDSQFQSGALAIDRTDTPALSHTQGSFSVAFSEEKLDNPEWTSQPVPETVPETQIEDSLPTFAGFNNGDHTTQALSSFAFSTTETATVAYALERPTDVGQSDANVIKAFEQSQQQNELSQSQHTQASANRDHSQTLSEAENNRYSFEYPKPAPNSGSKRVSPTMPSSKIVKPRESEQRSGSARYRTPIFAAGVDNTARNEISSSPNSALVFAHQTQPKHGKTYHHTPKHIGGKERASQPNAGHLSDPRLAGRDQRGTKRKPDGSITEGYEDERKKRLAVSGSSFEKNHRHPQPQRQQSIRDLPTHDGLQTRSQTRAQTFAGANPRTNRPTKNLSQS